MRHRILFILKHRHHYHGHHHTVSSGLLNSARFVVDMLHGMGIEAKLVEVRDNNSIDREVTLYQPTHVIIEALWVVPSKFDVLMPLHPGVRWIVRLHSKIGFLANEGIAMGWVPEYLRRGIEVQCNCPHTRDDLRAAAHAMGLPGHAVTFLPNVYPAPDRHAGRPHPQREHGAVHIGCFGAVRPLKNHLTQAIAALTFADALRLKLRFHINSTRVEGKAEPVLKNLQELFKASSRHDLIEHPWLSHDEFLQVLSEMDLAMQVSFSETFNIVTADAVDSGVPVVVSPQVGWLGAYAQAHPSDAKSIALALLEAWEGSRITRLHAQRRDLAEFGRASEAAWGDRFAP